MGERNPLVPTGLVDPQNISSFISIKIKQHELGNWQ
jgi:hypothetical protein